MEKKLTCIECPIGCLITVALDGDKVLDITGNTCPRGKLYAQNEMVCPRRVLTTTVKTTDNRMLAVKSQKPIKKSDIFTVMEILRSVIVEPKKIGEVVVGNIVEDINIISAQNLDC